ncbi:hypothetical protein BLNAU_17146 [Blattamonas nauphoetae]|uniref:Uncharacterized protein n=1 Tax=Blattamonas nauphoetae TaxID=2049346 RepID=A0ABQ9XAN0_9EUKA|nr:hypothetical protein BLNAU_17146 [Blattamonas nauphoetae]
MSATSASQQSHSSSYPHSTLNVSHLPRTRTTTHSPNIVDPRTNTPSLLQHTQHSHLASPNATHHHTPLSTSVTLKPHFSIPAAKQEHLSIRCPKCAASQSTISTSDSLLIYREGLIMILEPTMKNVHQRFPLLTQNDGLSTAHPVTNPLAAIADGYPQLGRIIFAEVSIFSCPFYFLANTLHSFHPHHQFLLIPDAFDSAAFVLPAALFSTHSPSSYHFLSTNIIRRSNRISVHQHTQTRHTVRLPVSQPRFTELID